MPGAGRQRRRDPADAEGELHPGIQSVAAYEHMFYPVGMRVEYREEPCRTALNRVKGMPFAWSLNPYSGCAHRCTFCYVRAFERRADRPSDDRYGRSIRVKVNVAEVLARELGRRSWANELVTIGAATDPYQPAEGRYRLTRACIEVFGRAASPFGLITRGPLIVRDLDVLAEAARRTAVTRHVLGADARRRGLADDRAGDGAAAAAPARAVAARRGRDRGERRHGADPPGPLRPAGAAGRGRQGGAGGGRDRDLGEPALPRARARRSTSSRRSRATGRSSSTVTRSSTHGAPIFPGRRSTPCGSRCASLARAHGVRDRRTAPLKPPPEPAQLSLGV